MFSFLEGNTLTKDDFTLGEKKVYIPDFLYSNSVSVIYSPPKQGKTWLSYGISNTLLKRLDVKGVIYIDMDNGLNSLQERKIDSLLAHPKMRYVSRAKIKCSPMEYLKLIDREATVGNYEGYIFILETTKDFVDTDSKSQSTEFMNIAMRIRDAGGTLLIMHHATKAGRTISGVQVFINSPDNVYELTQKAREDSKLHFMLNVTHSRTLVKDIGVTVNTQDFSLKKLDEVYATMSEYEEEFVRKGKEAIKKNPDGLNKSQFLQALGYKRDDKTAQSTLDKFIDKFWKTHKDKNKIIYTLSN